MLSDRFFWVLNGDLAYHDRKDWAQAIVAAMGAAQWTAFALGGFFAVNLGARSAGVEWLWFCSRRLPCCFLLVQLFSGKKTPIV